MQKIEQIFYSDVDLSKFSNRRLKIKKIDDVNQFSRFRIESSFKMHNCYTRNFCYTFFRNLLKDKGIKEVYFLGNASCPWGLSIKQSNR